MKNTLHCLEYNLEIAFLSEHKVVIWDSNWQTTLYSDHGYSTHDLVKARRLFDPDSSGVRFINASMIEWFELNQIEYTLHNYPNLHIIFNNESDALLFTVAFADKFYMEEKIIDVKQYSN